MARVRRDDGERDKLRERVRAWRPAGEERLVEIDEAEARVCCEEVVRKCDGGVGQTAEVVRVDEEPELL